jgi:hypothetical protein
MNKGQEAALGRLKAALNNCHKKGLRGGVYEYRLRVWPVDGPDPCEAGPRFFEVIEEYGGTADSPMILDGRRIERNDACKTAERVRNARILSLPR